MYTTDTISIVGYGNVGSHLTRALIGSGIHVSHIYSTSISDDESDTLDNVKIVNDLKKLPNNQITLVCVPDDAISSVLEQIDSETPIAYTSGSVELSQLPDRKYLGVFYPLQSFSKGRELNYFEIPIFIESNNEYFTSDLFNLGWKISRTVKYVDSEYRANMHVSAVIINNFTNHLVHLAQKFAHEKEVDFSHLMPLLHETINKLHDQPAKLAQACKKR